MAYNNTNMLRIAQIGAMNRPDFRQIPTLDLSGTVEKFFNAKNAAEQRALDQEKREKLQMYADVMKQQNPEDVARIDADPLAYMAMLDDKAKAERDQQYKMDFLRQQFGNSMALENMKNKNAVDLAKLKAELKVQEGMNGIAPDGTPLTGIKKYDDAYMQEVGKKSAQAAMAEKDAESMKPALIQAMVRADLAAKSGSGVGLIGGTAANLGLNPTKNAGNNYADIQSANTQMNTFLRKQLAATGLTGSELNSAVEAEAYRYQIKPTDSESVIRRKLQNFAADKLGGIAFNMNTGQAVNQPVAVDYKNKYGLE